MREDFPKAARLLKRREFRAVAAKRQRVVGRRLVLDYRVRSDPAPSRLGLTVTRKYGPAVERNRFKRLLREAYRKSKGSMPEGMDLVVRPRSQAKGASLEVLGAELNSLVSKLTRAK